MPIVAGEKMLSLEEKAHLHSLSGSSRRNTEERQGDWT